MNNTESRIQPQASGSAIARDFQNVVTDTQELLKTIGNEGDAHLVEVKSQARRSLQEAAKRLDALQTSVTTGTRKAARTTDAYVHDHPWGAIGIGAAFGVFVGYLLARR